MLPDLDVSLPAGGVATYPAGASFGPRVMHDWEFVWMMEGDAEYRWGETTVVAPEGPSCCAVRGGGRVTVEAIPNRSHQFGTGMG